MAPATSDTQTARLRLVCEIPPPAEREGVPTEFGLQDQRAGLLPGEPSPGGGFVWTVDVTVAPPGTDERPRFRGPYVHGPAGQQFLYLSWRRVDHEPKVWISRLKIPLWKITADQAALAGADGATLLWTAPEFRGGTPKLGEWALERAAEDE